jgi:hypothetical protein
MILKDFAKENGFLWAGKGFDGKSLAENGIKG